MFYDQFKSLCDSKGISPTAVVTEIGLSSSKVTAWKNGTEPKSDILLKIADYFNVSTDYLLGRDKVALPIISTKEIEMIKKYRALNEHGKQSVEALLNFEYSKSTEILKIVARDGNTQFVEVDSRTLDEELEKLKNIKPRTDL